MQIRQSETLCLRMDGNKLVGTAVVYNQQSSRLHERGESFYEIMKPGALDMSRNITFVFRHNDDAVYGDTASGTLRLHDTDTALEFELDLPPYAQRIREGVESGKIKGTSIAFTKDKFERQGNRHIVTRGKLMHVSAVAWAAYPTRLAVSRSVNSYRQKLRLREYIIL